MSKETWYIKWEPRRWRSDPSVAGLTTLSKGTWFQILNAIFENGNTGNIEGTKESIARTAQIEVEELELFLQENKITKTADVTDCNEKLRISNRKVTRAYKERERVRKAVAKSRQKPECNEDVTTHSNSNSNSNSKKEDIYSVFNYWSSKKNTIKHRELTQAFASAINAKLNLYSVDEIKSAIDEYDFICGSDDHYWNYSAWSIKDFLNRGLEKFLPSADPRINFAIKGAIPKKRQESDFERRLREKKEQESSDD